MALEIVRFETGHRAAVERFNQRLASGGVDAELRLPLALDSGWLPGTEVWLAAEDGEVRGGYLLRRQMFSIGGALHRVAHYRLPLSEGLVNRAYAALAVRLVRDALAREPRLYALGMGGWDRPLPQMLRRMHWRMAEVPFFFKVPHPFAFLREIRTLRGSAMRRLACDAAAFSGIGWLAMKAAGIARRTGGGVTFEMPTRFAQWADAVWKSCGANYGLAAVRDAATLDAMYPPESERFVRVRTASGWAVVLDTKMRGHKQFGDLRVGTIVDCLAADRASAAAVIRTAARMLEERGVDLMISNQLHGEWGGALQEAGFRRGPSNFLVGISPGLAELVKGEMHVNRGDGDGPIHL